MVTEHPTIALKFLRVISPSRSIIGVLIRTGPALIVRQRERIDMFGRPAVPVAGFVGVGRVRTD